MKAFSLDGEMLMSNHKSTVEFGVVVGALLLLVACSANHEEQHWTEDVQLEDGSVVQVERHVEFDTTNALGGGAGNAVETRATLTFKGGTSSLPVWDFPRIALVLYRTSQTSRWVIVSATMSCKVWARSGKPRPPYWQHELIGGQWREVPLSEESIGKETNLLYRYWNDELPKRVSSDERAARQSSRSAVDIYRSVSKDPADFHCMG